MRTSNFGNSVIFQRYFYRPVVFTIVTNRSAEKDAIFTTNADALNSQRCFALSKSTNFRTNNPTTRIQKLKWSFRDDSAFITNLHQCSICMGADCTHAATRCNALCEFLRIRLAANYISRVTNPCRRALDNPFQGHCVGNNPVGHPTGQWS